MPDSPGPNLRLLAPVAVAVFAIAMLIVLISSGALAGDSGESAGTSSPSPSGERREENSERRRNRRERGTYTVQAGDTLGSIAEDRGVSVERIQELNPELDPQALNAGQRIRLRE